MLRISEPESVLQTYDAKKLQESIISYHKSLYIKTIQNHLLYCQASYVDLLQ